jgi:hypothetical protein
MTNPYLPTSPISFPSQQFTCPLIDETENPSTTNEADQSKWPPSMDVNETATASYATVACDKTTDTVTSVDVIISGSFYLYVRGENRGSSHVTWQGVYPAMWLDIYITAAPDGDIEAYDGRSDSTGPLTITHPLRKSDGYPGLYGHDDLFIPKTGVEPLEVPMQTSTVTITDPTTIALFEDASGTQNVYIKPRAVTPQESLDGGTTWGDFGSGDVNVDSSKIRFMGQAVININRV